MSELEEIVELTDGMSLHLLGAKEGKGLELLRSIPGLKVHARGNRLSLSGTAEGLKRAKKFLRILTKRLAGGSDLEPRELQYLFEEATGNRGLSQAAEEPFGEIITSYTGRSVRPKTYNQLQYVESMRTRDITVAIGPAGTGKTYLAIALAIQALREKQVNRVILSRPTIEAGEKLGFLPGDIMDKVDPYFRPLYDAMQEFLGVSKFQQLSRQNVIEITPLGFMRGRTFNEAFIILDEAQNTTIKQMQMFLTRMGYGSRMVVTGDHTQVDLPHSRDSSLMSLKEVLGHISQIGFVKLQEQDVVRHDLVRDIIKAYENFFGESGTKP